MFEECKSLQRTLWTVCVLMTPLTGLIFVGWYVSIGGIRFQGTSELMISGGLLMSIAFCAMHGVAAISVRRRKAWGAQASTILASIWIMIGAVFCVVAAIAINPCALVAVLIILGGSSGVVHSRKALAEIKADDGWSRDGPLRDSKGFQVVISRSTEEPRQDDHPA